jgi:hypothetical protein
MTKQLMSRGAPGAPRAGWWLFHGKSAVKNGWFGGTTILGNLHIYIYIQSVEKWDKVSVIKKFCLVIYPGYPWTTNLKWPWPRDRFQTKGQQLWFPAAPWASSTRPRLDPNQLSSSFSRDAQGPQPVQKVGWVVVTSHGALAGWTGVSLQFHQTWQWKTN